jgi:IS5 family transposase
MMKRRYHRTGKGSFFGDYVYDQVVPRDHFLVALDQLFDWGKYSEVLIERYQGKGLRGRPPYDPVVLLKMLFVSYLYNVSERDVESLTSMHLAVKWFVGLAVDEQAPDHSTLTKFKQRLVRDQAGWGCLQQVFQGMLGEALEQGVTLGQLQVLDSVHTTADVNKDKDQDRQEQGKPPRDPDARVVNKGQRTVVEADGSRKKRSLRYRGYKTHVSVNAETCLVTALHPSLGNMADNKAFAELFAQDRSLDLPTRAYGGDKAYDDTDIYEVLEAAALDVGICLRDFRLHKKDTNKQRWEALVAEPGYQQATRQRYRVEQPFGLAKQKHGFARCRYLGLARYGLQALLTFLVLNCKRLVKLLTGLTFRPLAKGRRAEPLTPVYGTLPWV